MGGGRWEEVGWLGERIQSLEELQLNRLTCGFKRVIPISTDDAYISSRRLRQKRTVNMRPARKQKIEPGSPNGCPL